MSIRALNEFVVKFANVNGSGSASANHMFAKAVFRMGIPVSPKNIFPSNIQGLPTWYEVRISARGQLARGDAPDLMVAMNPQSMGRDLAELREGGYFLYDSSKPLLPVLQQAPVEYLGIPLTELCAATFPNPVRRQLFKNIVYVGALAALLDMDLQIFHQLIDEQFRGKKKLVDANIQALELGHKEARARFSCPLGVRLQRASATGDSILMDGNSALALGALYGGATFAAWYPITPSTSVAEAFENYAKRFRTDEANTNRYAILQAEDELAAIGMVIGAGWNGCRAFTATSGPGISLMSEFLGLAYFAEVPVVIFNIQRVGPSTGMPTRTQQSDILACAYASHGDTRHVLLFPSDPAECFHFGAQCFDLAERLQTPVIVMSDLDLGMNDISSPPLHWDDKHRYDRGKLLSAEDLEQMENFGRYLDVDGDGICYRTLPGVHPQKGAFFTRGTSRDPYAVYTEDGAVYTRNMERLMRKWESAAQLVPQPEIRQCGEEAAPWGIIYFGSSTPAVREALAQLAAKGIQLDALRLRAFPFHASVKSFLEEHDAVFVMEQNRDGQMRTLLLQECAALPAQLLSLPSYDGMSLKASTVVKGIRDHLDTLDLEARPLIRKVAGGAA